LDSEFEVSDVEAFRTSELMFSGSEQLLSSELFFPDPEALGSSELSASKSLRSSLSFSQMPGFFPSSLGGTT